MKQLLAYLTSIDSEHLSGRQLSQQFCFEAGILVLNELVKLILQESLGEETFDPYEELELPDVVIKLLCEDVCDDHLEEFTLNDLGWEWLRHRADSWFKDEQLQDIFTDHFEKFLSQQRNTPYEDLTRTLQQHDFIQLIRSKPEVLAMDRVMSLLRESMKELKDFSDHSGRLLRLLLLECLLRHCEHSPDRNASFVQRLSEYGFNNRNWLPSSNQDSKLARVELLLTDIRLQSTLEGLYVLLFSLRSVAPFALFNMIPNLIVSASNLPSVEEKKQFRIAFTKIKNLLIPYWRQLILNLWNNYQGPEKNQRQNKFVAQIMDHFAIIGHCLGQPKLGEEILAHSWMNEINRALESYSTKQLADDYAHQ